MKRFIWTGVIVLASAMSAEAMAACSPNQVWSQVTNLISTLTNNGQSLGMTACSSTGKGTQEEHHSNGQLWDYKCGNSGTPPSQTNPACAKPNLDPRKSLGTWSVVGDGTTDAAVTYTYTAFGNAVEGPFKVYTDGSIYEFCGAQGSSLFTLVPTTGSSRVCPEP